MAPKNPPPNVNADASHSPANVGPWRERERFGRAPLWRETVDRTAGRIEVLVHGLGGRHLPLHHRAGDTWELAIEVADQAVHPPFLACALLIRALSGPCIFFGDELGLFCRRLAGE